MVTAYWLLVWAEIHRLRPCPKQLRCRVECRGPLGTLGRKRFHGHHSVTIATILEMMKGDNAMVAQSGYSQFQVLFKKKNMFVTLIVIVIPHVYR